MKSEEMLKAMSDIRPEFVEEAAESTAKDAENAKDAGFTEASTHRKSYRRVTKWVAGIAAVFVVCLGIGAFTGGDFFMGSGDYNGAKFEDADWDEGETADFAAETSGRSVNGFGLEESKSAAPEMAAATEDMAAVNGPNIPVEAGKTATEKNVKLIYRANVNLQAVEYDEAIEAIKALVTEKGGYIESSSASNGGYFETGYYRYGSFVIRVPQENYRDFLDNVGKDFHITSMDESTEDIGTEYFETETRLKSLRTKEARLQELLADAKDIGDMVEIENALSNTEYEIDMYTSTLNRYDSLVGYSTINLCVSEVGRVEGGIGGRRGFGELLLENLKDGAANFVDVLAGIAYWISYNIITILIIVVLVIICIKVKIVTKIKKLFLKLKTRA